MKNVHEVGNTLSWLIISTLYLPVLSCTVRKIITALDCHFEQTDLNDWVIESLKLEVNQPFLE